MFRNNKDTADVMGPDCTRWHADWQSGDHARLFDSRHVLDGKNLIRNYESFNDVWLLNEHLDRSRRVSLLEVGCATGEFYRYLRIKYPQVDYYGIDISRAAIVRAREKYPRAQFFLNDPNLRLVDTLKQLGIPEDPDIVYVKDVVHHQTNPWEFVTQLLEATSETLIMRVRTREVGPTVTDPELSCQYHYDGWMPYIVMNLQELIDHITSQRQKCELVVHRNHVILGGRENRFLPKECYLPETGTAETAVGVFLRTEHPGSVRVADRKDQDIRYSLDYRLKNYARRILRNLVSWGFQS